MSFVSALWPQLSLAAALCPLQSILMSSLPLALPRAAYHFFCLLCVSVSLLLAVIQAVK